MPLFRLSDYHVPCIMGAALSLPELLNVCCLAISQSPASTASYPAVSATSLTPKVPTRPCPFSKIKGSVASTGCL